VATPIRESAGLRAITVTDGPQRRAQSRLPARHVRGHPATASLRQVASLDLGSDLLRLPVEALATNAARWCPRSCSEPGINSISSRSAASELRYSPRTRLSRAYWRPAWFNVFQSRNVGASRKHFAVTTMETASVCPVIADVDERTSVRCT